MKRKDAPPDPQAPLPTIGYKPPPEYRGGDHGRAKNIRHGYYSLIKLVSSRRGLLDRRTIIGKMVEEVKEQMEADLGGDLSTAEKMIVHDIAIDTVLLQAVENEIATNPPVVNGKTGPTENPVYTLRLKLVGQRQASLKLLGTKRIPRELDIDPNEKARQLALLRESAQPTPPQDAEIVASAQNGQG